MLNMSKTTNTKSIASDRFKGLSWISGRLAA